MKHTWTASAFTPGLSRDEHGAYNNTNTTTTYNNNMLYET